MIPTNARPSRRRQRWRRPRGRHLGTLVLLTLFCGAGLPALGAGGRPAPPPRAKDARPAVEARSAGVSGIFVVGKEYGTVRGTFLTDVHGRDVARLNFLFGEDVAPRFSPTDDRVLFTSVRGGTPGLWSMNRQGQEQRRICDGDQGDWFPDGARIAFRRQGQIIERSLATGQETARSPAGWKSCSWPACAPDGRKLLFLVHDGGKDALCLVTPGQSAPQRFAEGESLGAPRWAPDGVRIVYQRGAHLWMIDADGSHPRQLTTAGGVQRRPAWSPDGTAIAYCQGPNPNGPWQMAVINADGTRNRTLPLGNVRSVLCSDWGAEQPGRKPAPQAAAVWPPPRIQWWQIDPPLTAAPTDWAAVCRERKGWHAVPPETALAPGRRGGCAVENDSAVFLLRAGRPAAVLVPKSALGSAIEFSLLDPQGRDAGPVETIRLLSCGPDEATWESSAHSAGAPVKATWAIGGSRALVQVTPRENADKLRLAMPMHCVVVPDRFGNDVVADPQAFGGGRAFLPWAPLVMALAGKGSEMLALIGPEPGQRTELFKGSGPAFAGADVAFQNHALSVGWLGRGHVSECGDLSPFSRAVRGSSAGVSPSREPYSPTVSRDRAQFAETKEKAVTSHRTPKAVAGPQIWHRERFGTDGPADPIRFQWSMPYAAAWRLAVQGDGQRYSAFFSDRESAHFDKKDVLFRKSTDFSAPVRLGVIYLYGRTGGTPLDALTPLDLVRDALGLQAVQRVLDEDGLTGYRRAARPTTWAEFSVTLDALRYLFERQLEVQDSAYARHLCDDLLPFVEGLDQRLQEYVAFAREIEAWCRTADPASPAAAKLRKDLATTTEKLRELGAKQRALKSSKELVPLCTKIAQLTATESSENRKQFAECSAALLGLVGPREELIKAYRQCAVELRDVAGSAALAQAELLGSAEKLRTLCQSVLRNRFYCEADWRGEDYAIPAYWLGPRPYE